MLDKVRQTHDCESEIKEGLLSLNTIFHAVFNWKLFCVPVASVMEELTLNAHEAEIQGILYKLYEKVEEDDKFIFLNNITDINEFYQSIVAAMQVLWSLQRCRY